MKLSLFGLGVLFLIARSSHGEDPAESQKQAAAAQAILTSWQKTQAEPCERVLHIVCWSASDRKFPAEYRERLSRMLLHIQNFYAVEMERNGLGRISFSLKLNAEGKVVLHEVRGTHPNEHYEKKSGSEIRKECLPVLQAAGVDADQETVAIFCNLATWDEKELRFSHKSPYYAGGTYRSGTAWQLDSPELDILNLPKKAPMIRDGEYGQISLGKHNTIFVGGMAHELGHAFGLPHNKERPDEGVRGRALMGSGNQTYGDELRDEGPGTFLPLADALRLASHPLFCGKLEAQTHALESSLTQLTIRANGKAIEVSGILTGTPPIYGVVAYFDPEGNSDYNQTSATAVPAQDGRFTVQSDALAAGKHSVLHIVPLHANGAIPSGQTLSRMRYSYRVGQDGTPDLKSIQTRQALEPVVEAINMGDLALARRRAREVKQKEGAKIATVLVDATPPVDTPALFRGKSNAQSLTSFKADSVKVGWARPTFNRIPEASILLESAGEVFSTGIYAHAPARHEYTLGGKWDTLRGKVGIASGQDGSVRFEIHGDGRELWHSETVAEDQLVEFDVAVQGVERVELKTATTDDGASGDWGLWLEPELLKTR